MYLTRNLPWSEQKTDIWWYRNVCIIFISCIRNNICYSRKGIIFAHRNFSSPKWPTISIKSQGIYDVFNRKFAENPEVFYDSPAITHDKRQGNSIETTEPVFNLLYILVSSLTVFEMYFRTHYFPVFKCGTKLFLIFLVLFPNFNYDLIKFAYSYNDFFSFAWTWVVYYFL